MDVVILLFFTIVSTTTAILGYLFGSKPLGLIGSTAFLLTGFSFLLTGVDVQTQYYVTNNFTALDKYYYDWNATAGTQAIANISTTYNNTLFQRYAYVNQTNDYTYLFAALLMAVGLMVGFESLYKSREKEET